MRTIATANQKGGCGKTTTAINTAASLAARGSRVLLVDLDPQAHVTLGLGLDPDAFGRTVYHTLTDPKIPISTVVEGTKVAQLDLVPGNILLENTEQKLAGALGKELILASELGTIGDRYDFCIIDCPPSLGMLTLNGLVAATDVIVPVQVHYYALESLKRLLESVRTLRERFHPCSVKVLGLLLTFAERTTVFSRDIQQKMRGLFGDLVFRTVIHQTVRLAEAPSAGEPVLTYAPQSQGATDYKFLAEEILNRITRAEQTPEDSASDDLIIDETVSAEEIEEIIDANT